MLLRHPPWEPTTPIGLRTLIRRIRRRPSRTTGTRHTKKTPSGRLRHAAAPSPSRIFPFCTSTAGVSRPTTGFSGVILCRFFHNNSDTRCIRSPAHLSMFAVFLSLAPPIPMLSPCVTSHPSDRRSVLFLQTSFHMDHSPSMIPNNLISCVA
ncbi:hypothetical protein SISNIDRAFT_423001 [Sistotremastrum niveocremeum HHB9708]|uniref:Uncharacterized protein n=1 Tax=Sistotremastrum niveocremeum HHB9708 TaxID=1314777 RepID=A0A164ZFB7_9AGAM|nr:hypothetical protein SISNIDRAFT_423001 [Sistotremastrum niveocremeum HHB9708]